MTKSISALLCAALLVPGAAFGADAAKKAAAPKAAKAQPAEAKPAEPKPAADPAAADPQAFADATALIGEAMQAAQAAPKGATACETAFNGMEAMIKVLEKAPGAQKGAMPPKAKFLAACAELPVAVQNCMSIGYAMSHMQECQEAQQKLDPATLEKMKKLAPQ